MSSSSKMTDRFYTQTPKSDLVVYIHVKVDHLPADTKQAARRHRCDSSDWTAD